MLLLVLYAVVPPPLTPLMALRWFDGAEIRKTWTPLERVAPAVLPNPREWSPDRPMPTIAGRAVVITRRMGQLGPLLACIGQR